MRDAIVSRRRRSPLEDGWRGFALLAPALGLVVLLKGVPVVFGVITSLQRNDEYTLVNYARMLSDPVWMTALGNAARGLAVIPIFVVAPLVLAIPIFLRVPGWRFFRATFFLSNLLPAVVVGLMFRVILGFDGPVVQAASAVGFEPLASPLLSNPDTSLWAVYLVVLWTVFGLGVLVYLGGLASIPTDLIDAARVDGAGFFSLLRFVLAPLILPTTAYWAFVCTAEVMLFNFPFVFALTGGGPGYSSMLPQMYIYQAFTQLFDPAYSAALGITFGAIVAVIALIQVRVMYSRTSTT